MSQLILLRHGQSLWNAANKFTGWLELKTGVPIVYEIDAKGEVKSKVILND
ncbi:MAG: hypothetical protein WAN66_02650 [Limnoraphis robusta]|uniref:hypothetical protein n=1 Tax=Limnoraphis robusta TaxID=1118279 RepID=UPI000A9211C2|nr:hypothetical protein [Limnoraphis robusta]